MFGDIEDVSSTEAVRRIVVHVEHSDSETRRLAAERCVIERRVEHQLADTEACVGVLVVQPADHSNACKQLVFERFDYWPELGARL